VCVFVKGEFPTLSCPLGKPHPQKGDRYLAAKWVKSGKVANISTP